MTNQIPFCWWPQREAGKLRVYQHNFLKTISILACINCALNFEIARMGFSATPLLNDFEQDIENKEVEIGLDVLKNKLPGTTLFRRMTPILVHLLILSIYTGVIFNFVRLPPKAFPTELRTYLIIIIIPCTSWCERTSGSVENFIRYEDDIFKASGFHHTTKPVDLYEGRPTPEINARCYNLWDGK